MRLNIILLFYGEIIKYETKNNFFLFMGNYKTYYLKHFSFIYGEIIKYETKIIFFYLWEIYKTYH